MLWSCRPIKSRLNCALTAVRFSHTTTISPPSLALFVLFSAFVLRCLRLVLWDNAGMTRPVFDRACKLAKWTRLSRLSCYCRLLQSSGSQGLISMTSLVCSRRDLMESHCDRHAEITLRSSRSWDLCLPRPKPRIVSLTCLAVCHTSQCRKSRPLSVVNAVRHMPSPCFPSNGRSVLSLLLPRSRPGLHMRVVLFMAQYCVRAAERICSTVTRPPADSVVFSPGTDCSNRIGSGRPWPAHPCGQDTDTGRTL